MTIQVKKKISCWVAVVLFAFVAFGMPTAVYAIDSEYSRESLKGIRGLYVLVEDLTQSTREAGFRKDSILKDVQMKLRLAGIQCLSQDQHLMVKGQPYLYVALSALRDAAAGNLVVYYLNIELIQNVLLERNSSVLVDAPTWSINKIGTTNRVKQVRNELKDFLDRFASAYHTANRS